MNIHVEFDPAPYLRQVDKLVRKQYPFARALALTRTAQAAQNEVRDKLGEKFIIRGKWVPGGIRIQKADKNDATPSAIVGSKDEFMARQETGGVKRGDGMGVPTVAGKSKTGRPLRKRPNTPTLRSKWPGALLATKGKGYFFAVLRSGKGGIFKRRGKGRFPIDLKYVIANEVRIDARWGFEGTVEDVVRRKWALIQARALEEATRGRAGLFRQR